eukprot:SAG31_NODE_12724_length_921_cov_1.296837_1_plen_216_part_00
MCATELRAELDKMRRGECKAQAHKEQLTVQLAEARAEADTLRSRLEAQEAGAAQVQQKLRHTQLRLKETTVNAKRVQTQAEFAQKEAAEMAEKLEAATRWRNNAAALVAEELSKAKSSTTIGGSNSLAQPCQRVQIMGGQNVDTASAEELSRLGDQQQTIGNQVEGGESIVVMRQQIETKIRREAELALRRHMRLVSSRCPRHQVCSISAYGLVP